MDFFHTMFFWLLAAVGTLFRAEPTFVFQVYGPIDADLLGALVGWFIARAIIAAPIAYFAKRKGYSWCGFFLVAWMFMPAASIAMILALPKLKNGKVVPSKQSLPSAPDR